MSEISDEQVELLRAIFVGNAAVELPRFNGDVAACLTELQSRRRDMAALVKERVQIKMVASKAISAIEVYEAFVQEQIDLAVFPEENQVGRFMKDMIKDGKLAVLNLARVAELEKRLHDAGMEKMGFEKKD